MRLLVRFFAKIVFCQNFDDDEKKTVGAGGNEKAQIPITSKALKNFTLVLMPALQCISRTMARGGGGSSRLARAAAGPICRPKFGRAAELTQSAVGLLADFRRPRRLTVCVTCRLTVPLVC